MHRFLACLLAALLPTSVFAQNPTIVIEKPQIFNVHIEGISGANGSSAAETLKKDLQVTGMFKIVGANEADYTIRGAFSGMLSGTLAKGASPVFNKSFGGDWREATHAFADAIMEQLTGLPGIASTQVAFVSAQSGSKEICLMDLNGENARQLTSDKKISVGPKISADATRIAYTSNKSGWNDVWVIDLANSSRRPVAAFPGLNSGAIFSPDGGSLALTLSKDGNNDLYTMPASGGSPTRLTRTRGTESSPTWSPNGSEIAYVSDDRGSPQIYIIPASGGTPNRIKTNASYTTEPAWSPDGKVLAYSIQAAGQFQIGLTEIASSQQKVLATGGTAESPSWTRNSRHLIYSSKGKLYLIDSWTGRSIEVTNGVSKCSQPSCSR
jgi:TolB protein